LILVEINYVISLIHLNGAYFPSKRRIIIW